MIANTAYAPACARPKPRFTFWHPPAREPFLPGTATLWPAPALRPLVGHPPPVAHQAALHGLTASRHSLPRWKRWLATLLAVLSLSANTEAMRPTLIGVRMAEQESPCAGWLFKSPDFAWHYDEGACATAGAQRVGARAKWLDNKRVLLVESLPPGQRPQRPPRVWLYTLVKTGGRTVTLQQAGLGRGGGKEGRGILRR